MLVAVANGRARARSEAASRPSAALLGPQAATFRFTPVGGGHWYVDDAYVDPYGKG